MFCGNLFNHLLKNVKGSFQNHESFSTSKPKDDDDVIECMQFGICTSNTPRLKNIPFAPTLFHVANVDKGEIKFVHGEEVREIVSTYEQEVKQRLESPTSTELQF